MINVYITNLGKYNEGYLIGKWLELPATDEEIENVIKEIGIDGVLYEEYFFTDWEVIDGIEISEYSSLKKLNEIATTLKNLNKFGMEICQCLMKNENCTLDEAIEKKEERIIINLEEDTTIDEYSNLAYSYINEIYGGVNKLDKETLAKYFDFKSFGHELSFDYIIEDKLNIAISNN